MSRTREEFQKATGRDEAKALAYMKKLRANVQVYTKSGGGGIIPVGLGQAGAGIFFIVDALKTQQEGYDVVVSFPKEGIGTATAAIALIKGAKNPDTAKKMIDWGSYSRTMPSFRTFPFSRMWPTASGLRNCRDRRFSGPWARSCGWWASRATSSSSPTSSPAASSSGLALARAIVIRPQVLLFDEPLSNLDAKLRVRTRGEIRRLQKDLATTSIYVTHDQEEAMAISDRIAVMNQGRIILRAGAGRILHGRAGHDARVVGFNSTGAVFRARLQTTGPAPDPLKDPSQMETIMTPAWSRGRMAACIDHTLLKPGEKVTACRLAMNAGAHFVKTSTGFGSGGATVADVRLMRSTVGTTLGVKASGGIRTLADALAMLEAGANRIGTSAGMEILSQMPV